MATAASATMAAKRKADAPTAGDENLRIVRETIESVVIAFILAFLFKTFAAEMFVIPTGSMAPTLMGRHKDVRCPLCGFRYQTSASGEVETESQVANKGAEVRYTTCPMCRYQHKIELVSVSDPKTPDYPADWKDSSYNGDRIVVGKFVYDVTDPKRWDVVVFKYPEGAKINYIKRLIGLPNETDKIIQGDIWVRPNGENDFKIARKPATKVRAMLQEVYDNDYVLDSLVEHGWPERWQPWVNAEGAGQWKHPLDAAQKPNRKVFEIDGTATGPQTLRYVNCPPTSRYWSEVWDYKTQTWKAAEAPRIEVKDASTAVRDFCAFNANEPGNERNFVTDLAVECQTRIDVAQGSLTLEMVKKGHRCQCRFDLKTGDAALSISGLPDYSPVAKNALTPGQHRLLLTDVDSQLLLWIDNRLVEFTGGSEGTSFEPFVMDKVVEVVPTPGSDTITDVSPVGITVEGAAATVEHLRVLRDIYYTSPGDGLRSYPWYQIKDEANIGPDEFWMLGDNSPQSSDGRVWGTVNRNLLTGKALFVYWPHSFDHTSTDGGMWFPFFPNFGRMGRVR